MKFLKRYLTARVYIAIGTYLMTLAALYIIYRLYAGAVATIFYYVLIYPPLLSFAYLGFGRHRKRKERGEKRVRALGVCAMLLLAGCAIAIYNIISTGGHLRLVTWQILSIALAGSIVAIMERKLAKRAITEKVIAAATLSGTEPADSNPSVQVKDAEAADASELVAGAVNANFAARVNYVIIVFSTLLLTTIIFIITTAPTTVSSAIRILEESGYPSPTFTEHYLPEAENLLGKAGPFGAYSFTDADGKTLWVDVAAGELIE